MKSGGWAIAFLLLLLPLCALAQEAPDSVAERVNRFGTQLPQEKVFLHTDNSAYFLGDTIFYSAYVTRTDRGTLSTLSGVLYVELLNADGYLVERQIINLHSGMGNGSIALAKGRAHYSGYYELRAYTRWMLNFGRTSLPHSKPTEQWFVRSHMAREYFTDYDKIYSRTFPVYDAPDAPGEYYPDITERPMQRLMGRQREDNTPVVSLFPEGGQLVADVPNRLYFEAATKVGRHVRGTLTISGSDGRELASAHTSHRGKGVLDFTPPAAGRLRAVFRADSADTDVRLSARVYEQGVALRPTFTGNSLEIDIADRSPQPTDLFLTVMHCGVVRHQQPVQPHISLPLADLPQGVLDLTVYDSDGRIWADRLVFNSRDLAANRLIVEGVKQRYARYEPISFTIRRPDGAPAKSVVSVSVTDADNSPQSTDNGSILTEMLLTSELKGFIEQPSYYFEKDDDTHRFHLDLLMATQGWRRFDWRVQSRPDLFHVFELNEAKSPRMTGAVYVYEALAKHDELQEAAEKDLEELTGNEDDIDFDAQFTPAPYRLADDEMGVGNSADELNAKSLAHFGVGETGARDRYQKNPGNLKREVTVHAEFITPDNRSYEGEMMTRESEFSIEQPAIDGGFYMHLAAADTTKWNTGKFKEKVNKGTKARKVSNSKLWIVPSEDEYPDYYVRLADPFPRHAHPYGFYRTTLLSDTTSQASSADTMRWRGSFDDRILSTVTIRTKRGSKRGFDANHPAYAMSAYTAFNMVCDAGLCPGQFIGAERLASDVARLLVGDMGVDRQYRLAVRRDGLPASRTMSVAVRAEYDKLENLDSLYIYTDYAPRHNGNPLWAGENQPEVIVDLRRFPDKARQVTYRDRFYVRQGFNVCEDFYHPDYSQAIPTSPSSTDHRRTLLWLPFALLSPEGTLTLNAFNNGKPTHIRVTVNGIDAKGNPLSN